MNYMHCVAIAAVAGVDLIRLFLALTLARL